MQTLELPVNYPWLLQPPKQHAIPGHQKTPMIERFAAERLPQLDIQTDRIYLPVYWSDYHTDHGWGAFTKELQEQLTRITNKYPNDRFFTISQGDDGPLVDIPRCLVFSSGGFSHKRKATPTDIPIPLLCDLRPHQPPTRRHIASFLGSIVGRSKVREEVDIMLKQQPRSTPEVPGFIFDEPGPGWDYTQMMADSKFAFAPRGYGKTSFRLFEAIGLGVVPVYITDEFWLPYAEELDWNEFAVLIKHPEESPGMVDRLMAITDEQYAQMQTRVNEVAPMFTMEGTCQYIKRFLERAAAG